MSKQICLIDNGIELDTSGLELLKSFFTIKSVDLCKLDLSIIKECIAILTHREIPEHILVQLEKCRYIGVRAHNVDYINSEITNHKGIKVVGIPQVAQNAVAEHTMSLIFAVSKQIIISHQNVISNKWRESIPPNYELRHKTLGIIGYGTIGKKVASLAKAFNMNVLIYDKEHEQYSKCLCEVLEYSDIITLHLSSHKQNFNFIDTKKIEMMKNGAILINTSRGRLLDINAVEQALISKKIRGVGLDVFDNEPYLNGNLFQLDNVVMTPHIAFYTEEAINKMNDCLIDNLLNFFNES